jgi:prepilin-type N-terminal cleavage/methylation domain-containing protein
MIIKTARIKAFSLIEISIVIVIVGILISGISLGIDLYKDYQFMSARSLIQNSRIHRINDLTVWFETVSEKSFDKNQQSNNSKISTWYDINPNSNNKYKCISPSSDNNPIFIENSFNGFPGIKFDGNNDYFRCDNISLIGQEITYFVVAKRISNINYASVFSSLSPGALYDSNSFAHFRAFLENTSGKMNAFRNAWGSQISHPGNNIPYIATGIFDGTNSIAYINGTKGLVAGSSGNFNISTLLIGTNWQNGQIENLYSGIIAEIIIYNRALRDSERIEVERYLSKKWNIKVS